MENYLSHQCDLQIVAQCLKQCTRKHLYIFNLNANETSTAPYGTLFFLDSILS